MAARGGEEERELDVRRATAGEWLTATDSVARAGGDGVMDKVAGGGGGEEGRKEVRGRAAACRRGQCRGQCRKTVKGGAAVGRLLLSLPPEEGRSSLRLDVTARQPEGRVESSHASFSSPNDSQGDCCSNSPPPPNRR